VLRAPIATEKLTGHLNFINAVDQKINTCVGAGEKNAFVAAIQLF